MKIFVMIFFYFAALLSIFNLFMMFRVNETPLHVPHQCQVCMSNKIPWLFFPILSFGRSLSLFRVNHNFDDNKLHERKHISYRQ